MNNDKEIFEKVYETPGAIWTHTEPPEELVGLVETKKIEPCKVIDVGCGEGSYSIYLAKKGFDVLGIDISEQAIEYAKQNAKNAGVKIRFIVMDLNDLAELKEKFDFVLEWAILHCIPFEKRKKYIESISKLLNDDGNYLSLCFNEQDAKFDVPGKKIRTVPEEARAITGGTLYFSSLVELKELFEPHFKIIENKVFEKIGAANRLNVWNYFFMKKI
ncbi:MAG: class I SAM-dependent methyltransferase [Candidatus Aenigmatarchaeota archaeon]